MVRPLSAIVATGVVALIAAPSHGHVEASVDANNRYLKISPMGDRVRLAYTVLFGEKPGAAMRRRLDRDRDGQISGAEADVLGRELAASLTPALTIAIDGAPLTWSWARVDVGLGTPSTIGGSLSVDLIAWLCVAAGTEHRLAIRDEYQVDTPGESELRLEEGPGVHLGEHTLGGAPMIGVDAAWTGKGGPITTGFELRYTVDASATRPSDGRCRDPRAATRRRARWPFVAGAAAALILAIALQAQRKKARR